MQTVTIESIERPSGAVVLWVATLHEVIPALASLREREGPLGPGVLRAGHRAGRSVLRSMLEHHLGGQCADARVVTDARGRPSLLGSNGSTCPVDISISHSHTHVAVAMSHCGPVGVDTESRTPSPAQLDGMPARVLLPAALERFAAIDPDARADELLRQWCAREALLKAWGVGLTRDPRSVGLPVPLPSSPLTVEGYVVEVISTSPIVCVAHAVLDGRRVRQGTGPYLGSEPSNRR